jgi:tetratricopeptide (TPR) repeat protein
MNFRKLYVLYRFYAAFAVIAAGIAIHATVHKGWQWAILFYLIGVSVILFDIFIGPMMYLQKLITNGDIDGAKEIMASIKFPNLLIKPVRQGYYMLQSNFAMANQNLDEAEANIRKSIASKSDMLGESGQEGVAYLQLGSIALQKGDTKEALKNLKIAIQKGVPDDDNLATAYIQICSIYAQRREIKVAKEYLRRANGLKVKSEEIKKHIKDLNKQMARA